jgi:hypothetical protein
MKSSRDRPRRCALRNNVDHEKAAGKSRRPFSFRAIEDYNAHQTIPPSSAARSAHLPILQTTGLFFFSS